MNDTPAEAIGFDGRWILPVDEAGEETKRAIMEEAASRASLTFHRPMSRIYFIMRHELRQLVNEWREHIRRTEEVIRQMRQRPPRD